MVGPFTFDRQMRKNEISAPNRNTRSKLQSRDATHRRMKQQHHTNDGLPSSTMASLPL